MSDVFSVADMTCGHCKTTVENAVSSLDGVRSAEVNLEAKTVTVNHDETVDSTSIVGAIEEAGYQVA